MNAYNEDWPNHRIETACVMPSSAMAAHFGGMNAFDHGKRRTLAQHLAIVGARGLTDGAPFDGAPFVTRWLGATYEDGSIGGAWITERLNSQDPE